MKTILVLISLLFVTVSCSLTEDSKEVDLGNGEGPIVELPVDRIYIFSVEEVAVHNKADDCYTIIDAKVYNITDFFGEHSGGDDNLLKLCGIDGSDQFTEKHGENEKAIMTKDTYYIGELSD